MILLPGLSSIPLASGAITGVGASAKHFAETTPVNLTLLTHGVYPETEGATAVTGTPQPNQPASSTDYLLALEVVLVALILILLRRVLPRRLLARR
jgi:hypothetical protein